MVQVVINRVETRPDEIRISKRQLDTTSGAGMLPSETGIVVEAKSVEAVRQFVNGSRRGDVRYAVGDREAAIRQIQENFNTVDSKPFTTASGEYIEPNRSSAVKSGNQKAREQSAAEERIGARRGAIADNFSNANSPVPVRTIDEIREDNFNNMNIEEEPNTIGEKLASKNVRSFMGVPIGAETADLEFTNTLTGEVTNREVPARTARQLLAAQSVFIRNSRKDTRDAFEKAGFITGLSNTELTEDPNGVSTDILRSINNFPAPVNNIKGQQSINYVDPNISASSKKIVGDPLSFEIKKIELAGSTFDPTKPETRQGAFTSNETDKGILGLKGAGTNLDTQLRVVNAQLQNPNLSRKERLTLEGKQTALNLGSGAAKGTGVFLDIGKEIYDTKGLSLLQAPADLTGLAAVGLGTTLTEPIKTTTKGFEATSNFVRTRGGVLPALAFSTAAVAPFALTDKGIRSGSRALRKSFTFTEAERVGTTTGVQFGDLFIETTQPQKFIVKGFNRRTGKSVTADLKFKTKIELPKEVAPNIFTESYAQEVSSLTFDVSRKQKVNLVGKGEFTIIDDTFEGVTDFTLKQIKQKRKGKTKVKEKDFKIETSGTVEEAAVGGVYEIVDGGLRRQGFLTQSESYLVGTKGSRPLSRSAELAIKKEQVIRDDLFFNPKTKEPIPITIFNIASAGKEKGIKIIGKASKEIPKGKLNSGTIFQLVDDAKTKPKPKIPKDVEIKIIDAPEKPLKQFSSKGTDTPTGNVFAETVPINKNKGLNFQSSTRITKNAEDIINTFYKARNQRLTTVSGLATDLTIVPKRKQILEPKTSLFIDTKKETSIFPTYKQDVSLIGRLESKQDPRLNVKLSTSLITGQQLKQEVIVDQKQDVALIPDLIIPRGFVPKTPTPTATFIPVIIPKITPISLFNEPKRRGRGKKARVGFAPTPDLLSAVTGYTAKRKQSELFSGAELRGLSPKAAKITKAASKNIFG